MPNRLEGATSLYLRQHADNPIDWYPWGDEAFERAKQLDRPVFLSVGYAACHWCHVMAHESFEDAAVAEAVNAGLIAVKVDREERPDVDEAYMAAVQLSSGRGGWPMSVFLTPDRKPFLAATYMPKEGRGGHPGFIDVCQRVAEAWTTERQALLDAADELAGAIEQVREREAPAGPAQPTMGLLDDAVRALAEDFDLHHGGFGQAPKFPPHTSIELLLAYAAMPDRDPELREGARGMAHSTLQQMALGGVHDHVGGGFHRYSVDTQWLLPHFEKMLVDNVLMLSNLVEAQATGFGTPVLYARTAGRLVEWLEREMLLPDGLYASGIDADSEGEEGRYTVWTCEEVRSVLGEKAAAFITAYGLTEEGNFADEASGQHTGANIPHGEANEEGLFDASLDALAVARRLRPAPALDDKAVVGWNGLAVGALARAGRIDVAERVAGALLEAIRTAGRVPRLVRGTQIEGTGFLEDYAYFADGLFALADVTESARWKSEAEAVALEMVEKFYDEGTGGFCHSSAQHEVLFGPSKPVFDQPAPSANGIALKCLQRLGDLGRAYETLGSLVGWMAAAPQATEALLTASIPLLSESAPTGSSQEVEVRVEPERWLADVAGVAVGSVVLVIPPGFHLAGPEPGEEGLTPTEVRVDGLEGQVSAPEGAAIALRGTVRFDVRVRLPEGVAAAEAQVVVRYQACTDRECLLPQERLVAVQVERVSS